MPSADNDDVEFILFHVKHPSLADAEAGKYLVQQVFYINAPYNSIQRPYRTPQIVGGNIETILTCPDISQRVTNRDFRGLHLIKMPLPDKK